MLILFTKAEESALTFSVKSVKVVEMDELEELEELPRASILFDKLAVSRANRSESIELVSEILKLLDSMDAVSEILKLFDNIVAVSEILKLFDSMVAVSDFLRYGDIIVLVSPIFNLKLILVFKLFALSFIEVVVLRESATILNAILNAV